MRKIFWTLLILAVTSLLLLMYVKGIVAATEFGPASVLVASLLLLFALFCLWSLFAYGTDQREAVQKIWLSAASILLAYAAMDLGLGYFFIPRLSPPLLRDQYVHHALAPNTHSQYRSREYSYIQNVNSLGLRGREIQPHKNVGTYRILMLGDSFTMGKGVDDSKTFSALLEQSLNRKSDALKGRKFEVLNAGVDSYAPILSYHQLQGLGATLAPDMVVLNLDMSDLIQETVYRQEARNGTDGGDEQFTGVRFTQNDDISTKVRDWADANLYVTRLILFHVGKRSASPAELNTRNTVILASAELLKHTLADDTADRTLQWQNLFASILDIKRYCDAHAMGFLLTVYPWGHQVSDKEWARGRKHFIPDAAVVSDRSIRIIEDFAKLNSVSLLNVFPAFRSSKAERPLYFSEDLHWTSAGHELMARELERVVVDQISGH